MTTPLIAKQQKFVRMVVKLLDFAIQRGYEITFGDAYRKNDPRNHGKRLAIDINLFKQGRYLSRTEDHKELGEYWESLGGAWGGRFGDGNHYSLEHNGTKLIEER